MDRLSRIAAAVLVVVGLVACGADDDAAEDAEPDPDTTVTTVPVCRDAAAEGLDIPDIPGTCKAPLVGLGFGIAFPQDWQATLLTEDALHSLENATLAQPTFAEAARRIADSGAVFYAAGSDGDGRVGELKVDVQDEADTSPEGIRALADIVVAADGLIDASVVEADDGRVRVDYRIPGGAADDGEENPETFGSQLFVPDGDRLWSLIVTSEDQATQDALLEIFSRSLTFDDAAD